MAAETKDIDWPVAWAFGSVLKELRQAKALSQEKLAELSGLHRNHVSYLERGWRGPTLAAAISIARALDIATADLVARVETRLSEAPATPPDQVQSGRTIR